MEPHCRKKQDIGPLGELIERDELKVNNDTDFLTCIPSQRLSIIDLALTNSKLGFL